MHILSYRGAARKEVRRRSKFDDFCPAAPRESIPTERGAAVAPARGRATIALPWAGAAMGGRCHGRCHGRPRMLCEDLPEYQLSPVDNALMVLAKAREGGGCRRSRRPSWGRYPVFLQVMTCIYDLAAVVALVRFSPAREGRGVVARQDPANPDARTRL